MEEIKSQILLQISDSEEQINSVKENTSDILDIAYAPRLLSQVSDLLISECKSINNRINNFEINLQKIKSLLKQLSTKTDDKSTDESMEDISLRLMKIDTPRQENAFKIKVLSEISSGVESQYQIIRELFNLSNNDYRYIDFLGIYLRVNFIQDSSPEEIRKWYDFGAINSIYLSSSDFSEIKLLLYWINERVKDYYFNNPTVSPKDILMIKFFSAVPDLYQEKRFPAYHFIQIGKAFPYTVQTNNQKEFFKFDEKDIHYRRAIGIRIVLQNMENSFKKRIPYLWRKKDAFICYDKPSKKDPRSCQQIFADKDKMARLWNH